MSIFEYDDSVYHNMLMARIATNNKPDSKNMNPNIDLPL